MSNPTVRPDSMKLRNLMNIIADELGTGFKFTQIDNGTPGVDIEDLMFSNADKAAALDVKTNWAGHPLAISAKLETLIQKIRGEVKIRQDAEVKKSLATNLSAVLTPETDPAELNLTGPYLEYYERLWNIAALEQKLHVLQYDLNGLKYHADIQKNGTSEMKALFLRQLNLNGCGPFIKSEFCSAHPDFPVTDPNSAFWPDEAGTDVEKFLETLKENSTKEEYEAFTSPYTVVREGKGGYEAVSVVNAEPFKTLFRKVAAEFEAISKLDIDEPSKKTAAAYAAACRGEGKNPLRPFDEAEEVWVTSPAPRLTFSFGPLEEDDGIDGVAIKRGFQMVIYRVREDITKEMKFDKTISAGLNNLFRADGFDIPPESQKERTLHVADVPYTTNFLQNGHHITLAQTIPNDGPAVDKFGRRVDVGANIIGAVFDSTMVPITDRILVPHQQKFVKKEWFVKFAELHELSHNAGFSPDQVDISNLGMGTFWRLEEGKANAGTVVGIGMINDDSGKPVYSELQIKEYIITYITNLVRQIRQDPEDVHTWGARAELGALFKAGAVEIVTDSETGKRFLQVNEKLAPATMLGVAEALMKGQTSNSKETAMAILKQDFDKIPQEMNEWALYGGKNGRLNDVSINVAVRQADMFAD